MEEKKTSVMYKILLWFVTVFSPKMEVIGAENLSQEPCVVVGNHAQMYGPIASEIHFPKSKYIWCAGQMMEWKEVPGYAYQDFWRDKSAYTKWFYKLLSYLITPLSVCLFNNAHTIAVHHDSRIIATFKNSIKALSGGANVIIFPEHSVKHNNIIYDFQSRFIDVAKMYYKKTAKALCFVPMYITPKLKKICLGPPIRFDPDAPIEEERERIRVYLMDQVTKIACALPEHTVIPYRNIPKKYYPKNTADEVLI